MNEPGEAIPAVNFGAAADFALGVEEELLLVDPVTHALEHSAVEVLERFALPPAEGARLPGDLRRDGRARVARSAPTRPRPSRPWRSAAAPCTRPAPRRSAPACTPTARSATSSTTPASATA